MTIEQARRRFIYVSERIKAAKQEQQFLLVERQKYNEMSSDLRDREDVKRWQIYVTDRLAILAEENTGLVEERASLSEELKAA